jgi:BRCT domain type II-containing protein
MQPSPCSNTSYTVLGDNAGPSKLAVMKKHRLRTLDKDMFLALITTRVGPCSPGCRQLKDKHGRRWTLSCIFTGELSSFSLDKAIDLAKCYGR